MANEDTIKTSRFFAVFGVSAVLSSWAAGQTNKLQVSVEGLYWRPTGLDLQIAAPTLNANGATTLFAGSSQGLEYDFAPGYRATVDWGMLTVDWLDLASNSDFSASCPPSANGCLMPLQEFPNSLRHVVDLAQASSQMRLQVFDVDFRFPVLTNSSQSQSALYWRLGVRYAKLWNNVQILYTHFGGSPAFMQRGEHTIDNMYGPTTTLDGIYRLASRLSAQGLLRVSVLSGRSHHDETIVTGPGVDQFGVFQNLSVNQTGTVQNVIVPVLELSAKIIYSPAHDLDVWIGYDFMSFSDVLITQNFTLGGGTDIMATDVRHSVTVQGPRAGLGWRFGRN